MEHIVAVALVDDLAALHNHDLIPHIGSYAQVMGYDNNACTVFVAKLHKLPDDLRLGRYVKGRSRFIG